MVELLLLVVEVVLLAVVMVMIGVVLVAAGAASVAVSVLPVLLAFVSKNYSITGLSRSNIFRHRLLELHSPKIAILS